MSSCFRPKLLLFLTAMGFAAMLGGCGAYPAYPAYGSTTPHNSGPYVSGAGGW